MVLSRDPGFPEGQSNAGLGPECIVQIPDQIRKAPQLSTPVENGLFIPQGRILFCLLSIANCSTT